MNSHRKLPPALSVRCFSLFVPLFGLLLTTGCSAPPKTTKAETPVLPQPKLAITLRVASVDLSGYGKRIEKKDIEQLSAALKREQIEILAVQGIVRYPNVKTRIDFVNELAAQMDMRHAFGESIDISGRQQGNAVFSVYPIRSNQKKEYDVPSAFYESALQVSIDAGVRDVAIVSTRLPAKASSEEVAKCMRTIADLQKNPDAPFVVTGNLPAYKKSRDFETFTDLQSSLPGGSEKLLSSRLWYVQGDLFRVVSARAVKTDLGTLTVAEFGLYQQTRAQ
jgi:endonuclease/exonuclease/phosphatase family metal-dependent hydrolase